jgi:hypothetical protein
MNKVLGPILIGVGIVLLELVRINFAGPVPREDRGTLC